MHSTGEKQPSWAPYVRLVIGGLLIAFGAYRWLTRKRSAHTPGWMRSMTSIGPSRAAITAVVLVVLNVKVLFMRRRRRGDRHFRTRGHRVLGCGRGVHGGIGVDGGAAGTHLSGCGERLDEPLNRLKAWMEEQHAALVAGILIVLGLMLLHKGIHALWPASASWG